MRCEPEKWQCRAPRRCHTALRSAPLQLQWCTALETLHMRSVVERLTYVCKRVLSLCFRCP